MSKDRNQKIAITMPLPSVLRKRSYPITLSVQSASTTSQCLTSPDYSSKLILGLDHLRSTGVLCDYTIVAGGLQMQVHRVVMVACSDYFRAMLTGDMRESKETSVTLQGVTGAGLQAVVEFAYSGGLRLNLDNVEEVLAAASHLQVSEVVDLCSRFLDSAVTIENCVDVLNITELYALDDSLAAVRAFILRHFEDLADGASDEYSKLSCAQLASLLAENSLRVLSEYRLFELVLRWINHDVDRRRSHVAALIRNVRLPLCSGEELVEKVSRVDMVVADQECFRLLVEAKDYHIVVNKQPVLQSSRTQVRSVNPMLVQCHDENLECYELSTCHRTYLKEPPVSMYSPCVCVVDNFMYVCGGKYDSNENNDIATARCFRYDPRFDSWFELASMNEARKDFAMVAFNHALYVVAGQDENMVMFSVERFTIANNEWTSCSTLPNAVYGHSAAICAKRIFISGGLKFDGHSKAVHSYDPLADTWKDEPPLLSGRCNHSMVEVLPSWYNML